MIWTLMSGDLIQYKIKKCYSDVILGLVYSVYDSPKAHMLKASNQACGPIGRQRNG